MAKKKSSKKTPSTKKNLRPPIVSVLGHVDHGKTTLLDKIRSSKVQSREAGGITQSIGASQVETKDGKKITFIDTPGHAAFRKMRSRGAKVADIAILVVAANDAVMPQTKEAYKYIKDSNSHLIVAVTKVDLSSISVEKTLRQLEKLGISLEGRGGDTPYVKVSGKTGEGIEELLEIIGLVSEVNDISDTNDKGFESVVIETNKDQRGPLVSAVVRNGKLSVGDHVIASETGAKVRGLFNDKQKPVKQVSAGDPVLILGFSSLPAVGTVIKKGEIKGSQDKSYRKSKKVDVEEGEVPVVIKAKSKGALDAVEENLPDGIKVISSGVGKVNDNDVFIAKSAEPSRIFVFETKVPGSVKKLADTEGVKIYEYDVIYKLFEKLQELVKEGEEEVLGEVKIKASFPFNNKKVAGCKVLKGRIAKGDKVKLMRNDKKVANVRIVSMRKRKEDVEVAKQGEELGIIFKPQLEFQAGDLLISIR